MYVKNFFQGNSQTKYKQTRFVYILFANFPQFCGDATTFFLHIKTSILDSPLNKTLFVKKYFKENKTEVKTRYKNL